MKCKIHSKYKKGFTLIEIMITLMIISILISLSSYSINYVERLNSSIKFDYYCNYVLNFINICKNYCKCNDVSGYIHFEKEKNRIKFCCSGKILGEDLIKYIKLPKNISIQLKEGELKINRFGYMSTACTIVIRNLNEKDCKKNRKEITISVGTGYIQIKKKIE